MTAPVPPWASAPAIDPASAEDVRPWIPLPEPEPAPEPVFDPAAFALGRQLAGFIALGLATDRRSLQATIGSSEIGWLCDRRVAYKVNHVPPSNVAAEKGRLRRAIGSGVHLVFADVFNRLDMGSGQFLVEKPVVYKGIPGTADLVFRLGEVVIDWKTAKKSKIARIRREGVPRHYQVQAQVYAAALNAMGESIRHVAVVYVPIDVDNDEDLEQIYVWMTPFNQAVADDAVARADRLRNVPPGEVPARPDRMCSYCAHHLPGSTDLSIGCPGPEGVSK